MIEREALSVLADYVVELRELSRGTRKAGAKDEPPDAVQEALRVSEGLTPIPRHDIVCPVCNGLRTFEHDEGESVPCGFCGGSGEAIAYGSPREIPT